MRLSSLCAGLLLFAATPPAAAQSSILEQSVVQLRMPTSNDPDAGDFECGVGVFVTSRLILTAAHVISGARRVHVSTAASPEEVVYDIKGGQAAVHEISGYDVAVLELKSDWAGEVPEAYLPLTRIDESSVGPDSAFEYASFHSKVTGNSCKGAHQGEAQGLSTTSAESESLSYLYKGTEHIRVRPALDQSYSGSPLLMRQCGKRPACVVGVQSESTNDGGSMASMVATLSLPGVSDRLYTGFGVAVEDYQDPRMAVAGFALFIGPSAHWYSGAFLHGASVGLQGGGSYVLPFGRLNDFGLIAQLALAHEWFSDNEVTGVLRSPDGSWQARGSSSEASSVFSMEASLGAELFRSSIVTTIATFGGAIATYELEDASDTLRDLTSSALLARLGTVFRPCSSCFVEVALVGRKLKYAYHGGRYTLVPNMLTISSEEKRGYSLGLQVSFAAFVLEDEP
jgi:hypothetical protein